MTHATNLPLARMLRRLVSIVGLLVVVHSAALAQLSGTKTVGGAGADYASIDAAIAALVANGVNGPLTFLINNGTYTPTASGYVLPSVTGMSATNTVTFKPASGASVDIIGTTNDGTAIFTFDDGDYYIIDGSNTAGGTTRNMLIRQGSTTLASAIWFKNSADFNVVKNATIQAATGTGGHALGLGGFAIYVGGSTMSSGNDSNLVQNNVVGDVNGTYRSFRQIYLYGESTAAPNIGTRIVDNDVVNFGNLQAATYGIFVSYHNMGTIVRGNTVRMTTATGTSFTSVFAIYCNEQLVGTLGNTANTRFERNKVYGLQTAFTSEAIYGLYYVGDNNTNSSVVNVVNNMFANDRGSVSTTYYGMFFSETNTSGSINVHYNSQYLGGAGSSANMFYANIGGSGSINHRNNIYYSTWTSGGYALFLASTTGWTSNNNLIEFNLTSASANTAYYNGAQQTLASYKTAVSPQESNSVGGNPQFISPSTGNLHIDPTRPTLVESRGVAISGVTTDFDGDVRSATLPDIGADEGNFNGAGLTVITPNGGESFFGGATIPIQFSASRPMTVRLEFTSDNGLSWSPIGSTIAAPTGTTSLTFVTPDIATNRARVRVLNTANLNEGDTSNATFNLLQPSITLVAPNGGETFYEGDMMTIRWSSVDIPSGSLVALDYSTNAGGTWLPIATNLVSPNSPSTNSYNWSIPSLRTTQALVRVRMLDKPISDVSNATFTILKSMNLLSPNGGEIWIAGEKEYVKWSVNRVNRLNIDLSTDGGATWTTLKAGVRSYIDSLQITVPNTPTTSALVRIVNSEQNSFTEQSAATFTIVPWAVHVESPNGGEKYELSQPVTVTWSSEVDDLLRLEYTANGVNWTPIASGIDSRYGAFTFTPPAFPTKLARVRLIVESRPHLMDASDAAFEIMEAPGIAIYSPSQGEVLMRGSTYEITWGANRINSVNIEYSSTGGTPGSWTRIASSVPALRGTYTWTVPSPLTSSGKIRIVEVGGSNIGESGLFSVIDPVASVRLLRPNGGESFTVGDPIHISWTASLVSTVALQFSTDGGASWRPIVGAENLPAVQGSYTWTATTPGTGNRVRVMSGALYDDSDANYTVVRALAPSITVLSPNGGEQIAINTQSNIVWSATDISGDVSIELSLDNGVTWSELGTAPAASGTYRWDVSDEKSAEALVRISGGGQSDTSDAVFEIFEPIAKEITVGTPIAEGELWTEGETVTIRWQSAGIDLVDIYLSVDDGATWGTAILSSIDATAGSTSWIVPHLLDTVSRRLRIKIAESATGTPSDVSDRPFGFRPLGVASTGGDAASNGLRLVGTFPNPFATQAEIRWSQSTGGVAELRLFNGDGRIVAESALGYRAPGDNTAAIDAALMPAGIYHFELRIGTATLRGSMMIAR
jgi:hypothetical protein